MKFNGFVMPFMLIPRSPVQLNLLVNLCRYSPCISQIPSCSRGKHPCLLFWSPQVSVLKLLFIHILTLHFVQRDCTELSGLELTLLRQLEAYRQPFIIFSTSRSNQEDGRFRKNLSWQVQTETYKQALTVTNSLFIRFIGGKIILKIPSTVT